MATNPNPSLNVELDEEAKLRQKYPNLSRKGIGAAALQKRLSGKGPKYFDSGDYNMARAKISNQHQAAEVEVDAMANNDATDSAPVAEVRLLEEVTGDTIPTPDNIPVPTGRKRSLTSGNLDLPHQFTHPDATVVQQHQQHQQQA
ncbi:hypothetical protein BOX15_Mlig028418g1 [Macrostomum lignano]|uniref:Uncharacterized protein n=1 Tax=Macrostomum lignano TaxID=282301 RepID=A0A267GZ43_9PLAT|nr:hypothetical protein BOX15_Mlig028418g1 [Macrostomum lignano]